MPGHYTHTTRGTGTTLTAAIYNADHQNHITNLIPEMMDDYSSSTAQMQSLTDPGELGSESLATTLAGELERLRFALKDLSGKTHWYESPVTTIQAINAAIGTINTTLGTLGTAATKTTGTASGNVPLVGTTSMTEALAGLARFSTIAETETGTLADVVVMLSRLIRFPGVLKVHGALDGATGSLVGPSFNVTAATRNSAGDYTIQFPAFSSSSYTVLLTPSEARFCYPSVRNTNSMTIKVRNPADSADTDTTRLSFGILGDL